jgi:hypothetical protein
VLKTDRYKISSTNSYWNFYRMMQYVKWPWCLCWLWGFTKQVGLGLCSSLAWFQMLVLRTYPKCVLKNPESTLQLTSPSTITLGQMHQCSQATMECFSRKETFVSYTTPPFHWKLCQNTWWFVSSPSWVQKEEFTKGHIEVQFSLCFSECSKRPISCFHKKLLVKHMWNADNSAWINMKLIKRGIEVDIKTNG